MIDTRAVGQELQEQLVGAARKGQEQAKKAQEQVRKGHEVVTGVVRTLTTTAEAFMPQLPTVKLPSLPVSTLSRLPGASRLPSAGTLRSSAQEIGEQLLAAQRKLTGEVAHAASPLIAQGTAHLNRAARTVGITTSTTTPADNTTGTGHAATHRDKTASTRPASSHAASIPADDAAPAAAAANGTGSRTGTRKASTDKASTTQASTAQASTDKPGTGKPSTQKASTQQASARKNGNGSGKIKD